MKLPDPVGVLRMAAVGEAVSWLGLLVGMAIKYSGNGEAGVHLFGPVHGAMFMIYALLVLPAARSLRWSAGDVLLALAAAVPPFTTLLIERRLRLPTRLR